MGCGKRGRGVKRVPKGNPCFRKGIEQAAKAEVLKQIGFNQKRYYVNCEIIFDLSYCIPVVLCTV
jgi:hypothetical protein